MAIRQMTVKDKLECLGIAAALPQWFTAKGISMLSNDISSQSGLVVSDKEQILGFLIYFCNQGEATISWMGIHPGQHRKGVGSLLLQELVFLLKAQKVKNIFVSTLGDSVEYDPYNQTRSFYRKNGSKDFRVIKHPDNPEQEEELVLCMQI